jgi:hypothetical protein
LGQIYGSIETALGPKRLFQITCNSTFPKKSFSFSGLKASL